jgi:rhodanese-related sulfurtransferase
MVVLGALAAYILWKYFQRQRFLYRLRTARISPQELLEKINAGEQVMIVDLRQPLDIETVPYVIPGALRMAMEDLGERHHEIPRDREVILYCS